MWQVVLCLHGIGVPGRTREQGEALYWISTDLFHETLERVTAARDGVAVHFTFDDGNASDLEIAAEPLARAGHSAEIFLLADRLCQAGSIGPGGIKALQAMGHRIGSHGAGHVDWTRAARDADDREFGGAKRQIEEMAGEPIDAAAIPFGRYDRRVLARLRAAGFARVYSSDGGPVGGRDWPIPRTSLRDGMTGADVDRILHGPEPVRRRLRRRLSRSYKRWI